MSNCAGRRKFYLNGLEGHLNLSSVKQTFCLYSCHRGIQLKVCAGFGTTPAMHDSQNTFFYFLICLSSVQNHTYTHRSTHTCQRTGSINHPADLMQKTNPTDGHNPFQTEGRKGKDVKRLNLKIQLLKLFLKEYHIHDIK